MHEHILTHVEKKGLHHKFCTAPQIPEASWAIEIIPLSSPLHVLIPSVICFVISRI